MSPLPEPGRHREIMPQGPSLRVDDRRPPPPEPPAKALAAPRRQSRGGWIGGFLMGVFTLAFLIVGGWVALEWFIFPAMDAKVGGIVPAPVRQSPVIPDSALRNNAALSPVPIRNVPEVPVTAPALGPLPVPAVLPPPLPPPPAAAGLVPAAPGETAVVQGSGISLRSGPANTEPVIANRSRGTVMRVFGRQNGWVQVGDSQPIGWGWAPLLAPPPTGQTQPAAPP